MPITPARIAQNAMLRIMKASGIRLSDDARSTTTNYVEIFCGDGAPASAYGRAAGTTLIYIRKDAVSASAAQYISVDGGTTWVAGQFLDAELTAIAGLVSAANKMIRFTGAGTAELIDCTAAGAALLDDASADAQLTTLGVTAAAKTILDDASTGAIRTTLGVGTGDSPVFAGATFNGPVSITGKLALLGSSVLVDAEHVDLRANYSMLNTDYTTAVAVTAGFVANYSPTATADTTAGAGVVVAGVDGVSDPTITTVGAATFAATDLVMISGSANAGENDGFYEVAAHAANLLTFKSTNSGVSNRVEAFTLDQLVANAGDVGMTITKVNVTVFRAGTDGIWESGRGSQTGIVYANLVVEGDSPGFVDTALTGTAYHISGGIGAGSGVLIELEGPTGATGIKRFAWESTVATGQIENPLFTVPANSVVESVQANCMTALTGGGTTVTWSVGITGDVDAYGTVGNPTDSLVQFGKANWMGDIAANAGASLNKFSGTTVDLKLIGAATGGAAAGDTALTAGTVKVRVVYKTMVNLADV